jgi:hypothetical protein
MLDGGIMTVKRFAEQTWCLLARTDCTQPKKIERNLELIFEVLWCLQTTSALHDKRKWFASAGLRIVAVLQNAARNVRARKFTPTQS